MRTPLRSTPWSSASRIRTALSGRFLIDLGFGEFVGRWRIWPAHAVVLHSHGESPLMSRHGGQASDRRLLQGVHVGAADVDQWEVAGSAPIMKFHVFFGTRPGHT